MKTSTPPVDAVLAKMLASTRTQKRPYSIAEIAISIEKGAELLGGLDKLANRIGISKKMVMRFLRYKDLTPKVRDLVLNRVVDSVDAVEEISKIKDASRQYEVASALGRKVLDTADVRAVVSLLKTSGSVSTKALIDTVLASKNKKLFVYEFVRSESIATESKLRRKLSKVVRPDQIIRVDFNGPVGKLVLNRMGHDSLRRHAKEAGLSSRVFFEKALSGYE